MRWSDLLSISLSNLWRRKLRTILTMAGSLIGTASIVIMISLGLGLNDQYTQDMEKSGALTFIEIYNANYYGSASASNQLDSEKLGQIAGMDGVKAVTPLVNFYAGTLKTGKYQCGYSLCAVDPESFDAFGYKLANGRAFTPGDTELELVLGHGTKSEFRNPNERIDWNNYDWTAIPDIDWLNARYQYVMTSYGDDGTVSERKIKASVVGELEESYGNENYSVFCSIDALNALYKKNKKIFENYGYKPGVYEQAWVKTTSVDETMNVLEALKEMGLEAYSSAEYIMQEKETQKNIQMFLGAIGAVAMLVAALSIANTMLMSIYERTKEIGVMKVLGCKLSNIGLLFLGEAGLIGLMGGLLGVGLSYALSLVLNKVLNTLAGLGGTFASVIPPWLALLALAFSVLVGVVAGLYPSQRAMRLSALAAIHNDG